MIEAQRNVISAVVGYGVNRMKRDPEFANRVAEKHFERIFDRQKNKDGVVRHAIEDLTRETMSDSEANDGPAELSSQFLHRFERFAEEASTDELRERWGRILSAEIRKPGTSTLKVIRIVDELDAETAQLFEKLCESRLANVLPCSLVGELSFADGVRLMEAGLLVDPNPGQIRPFRSVHGNDGKDHWLLNLGEFAVAFLAEAVNLNEKLPRFPMAQCVLILDETHAPSLRVYVLTEAGFAIAQILPNKRRQAFAKLPPMIRNQLGDIDLEMLEVDEAAKSYRPFRLSCEP